MTIRRILMASLPSDPIPWRTVNIRVTREVTHDLSKMQKVTANVLGRLGCPECHSGHILNFLEIRDFVVNPRSLDVQELGLPGL
jgi:hypothetical protein